LEDVFIGIGSNLGDRLENIARAETALAPFFEITGRAGVYETAAQYVTDQPRYLNSVYRGHARLEPRAFLEALQQLEFAIGRRPGPRNSARVMDLDILFYGDRSVAMKDLTIPHPRIQERYFVLRPIVDIAPELMHPKLGKTMRKLFDELPADAGRNARLIRPAPQ
jgi:2-amino-4-hydroxy-6-hydroxymethyldihydropteridine diphosphokinase